MKNSIILILFIIAIPSFVYGVSVGHYEIFPFDIMKNSKNLFSESTHNISDEILQTNISELIDIQSIDDIELKKSRLINYIWHTDSLPHNLPNTIEKNISWYGYQDIENLEQIEKIEIVMDYGLNSNPYLFIPENSNGKLIIYHRGHDGDFFLGKDTISYFIKEGYAVLAFSMPLVGNNNQPVVDLENFGKIKLRYHDDFELLDPTNFSPIKFFVEPIIVSLNYTDKNYNFESYYMVGISGGGWTTTLSAALDDRISKSYSVAGSLPFFLRSDLQDLGDYEQRVRSLYQIANYLELYTIASYGEERKHVQIFNKFDPCCFAGESLLNYYDTMEQKLSDLSGTFEIWIDDTHKEHKISSHMINLILSSMES